MKEIEIPYTWQDVVLCLFIGSCFVLYGVRYNIDLMIIYGFITSFYSTLGDGLQLSYFLIWDRFFAVFNILLSSVIILKHRNKNYYLSNITLFAFICLLIINRIAFYHFYTTHDYTLAVLYQRLWHIGSIILSCGFVLLLK
jgi:hypothetical protein